MPWSASQRARFPSRTSESRGGASAVARVGVRAGGRQRRAPENRRAAPLGVQISRRAREIKAPRICGAGYLNNIGLDLYPLAWFGKWGERPLGVLGLFVGAALLHDGAVGSC